MINLAEWQGFYILVGSSAGALIGLQFVLMALIADLPVTQALAQAGNAIATPTVFHFGAVLMLSGVMCAPWRYPCIPTALACAAGLAGFAYILVSARRLSSQTAYRPDPSDWFFYVLLPLAAYAGLAGSGAEAARGCICGLFGIGAATLLLLFIGIRNAWDTVTYHVFVRRPKERGRRPKRG